MLQIGYLKHLNFYLNTITNYRQVNRKNQSIKYIINLYNNKIYNKPL